MRSSARISRALGFAGILFSLSLSSARAADKTSAQDASHRKPVALGITPRTATVGREQTLKLSAYGGKSPYLFTIQSGQGSIDPKFGIFTSGNRPGPVFIRVFDSLGAHAEAQILIRSPIILIPPPKTEIPSGTTARFSASGGSPPYSFSLQSGAGSLDPETGLYTAGNEGGKAAIQVLDAAGQSDTGQITVIPPPKIPAPLRISPEEDTVPLQSTVPFKAAGGVPPYIFSKISGSGAVNAETGLFSSGALSGLSTVRVTDSKGAYRDATVHVQVPLTLYPGATQAFSNEKTRFFALGGSPPYAFSVAKGAGSIEPSSGIFTAGKDSGKAIIRVTDAIAASAEAEIIVRGPTLEVTRWKKIASSYSHTCAINQRKLKCWGDNKYGQLGTGNFEKSGVPVEVNGLDAEVLSVSAGYFHTCALLLGGTVKCWGDNRSSQLGVTGIARSATPVEVHGFPGMVTELASGHFHNCAVSSAGSVLCWGDNKYGQLGNGSTVPSASPVLARWLVEGAQSVAAGFRHSCAVVKNKAWCWGNNESGQLGDGRFVDSRLPAEVMDVGAQFAEIEAGGYHTCATTGEKTWCWGGNGLGQLGNSSERNSSTPVPLEGIHGEITSLSLGYYHGCLTIGSNAELKCWGYNFYGQLGDQTTELRRLPVRPYSLKSGATAVSAGFDHTCALLAEKPYCWGSNQFGQLGSGATGNRTEPEFVKKF